MPCAVGSFWPVGTAAGSLGNLLQQHFISTCLNSRGPGNICIFGYEDGRSATEMAATLKLLASAAHKWRNDT